MKRSSATVKKPVTFMAAVVLEKMEKLHYGLGEVLVDVASHQDYLGSQVS